MKENSNEKDKDESKRPPWRTVSVSTLPKPDKSALLRAKLLDASRRMRAGKTNIGVQTDLSPAKIFKEINIGVQNDLILRRDVGMLTDGSYVKRSNAEDGYILTYSVPTMTDSVSVSTVSTQTLLPKMGCDNFINVYYNLDINSERNGHIFDETEIKVLNQIAKIRELEKYTVCGNQSFIKTGKKHDNISPDYRIPPTLSSWQFDNTVIEGILKLSEFKQIQQKDKSQGTINFHGQRSLEKSVPENNLFLLVIDQLIAESNNLVDIVHGFKERKEQIALDSAAKLNFLNMKTRRKPVLPSVQWNPIIEHQEETLAKFDIEL